jgi:ATP-dependent RNA helicase DHX36
MIGPHCKIVITQPRRISAVSLAERIAYERSETVGDTVGYNIRLESVQSSTTQMLFVTPGVLLRKLIDDPFLLEFTHIIIDEAHERDRFTEFLLILLRDLSVKRPSIRIVLMSATMHIMKLTNYFGEIPTLSIGSSVFPVQEYYLEHILKFTNYFQAFGLSNHGGTHNAHIGVNYTCSFCNRGEMLSPEEFGTHAALCFPNETRKFTASTKTHQMKLQELQNKLQQIQNKFSSSALMFGNLPEISEKSENLSNGTEDENSDTDSDYDFPKNYNPSDLLEEGEVKELVYSEEQEELSQLLQQYNLSQKNQTDDQQIDFDLIILLLNYIVRSEYSYISVGNENSRDSLKGSILIFLPGWDDIMKLQKLLNSHSEFSNDQKYLILQLHSNIPKKDQQLVFQKCSIPTQRKIILSTNIAETSLTIDDVTVVINSGRIKEKVYDPHLKLSYLKSTYVSKASANQRRGRAGRTQSGVCFHLYSKLREKHLSLFAESELLRMPLEELVLQVMCDCFTFK